MVNRKEWHISIPTKSKLDKSDWEKGLTKACKKRGGHHSSMPLIGIPYTYPFIKSWNLYGSFQNNSSCLWLPSPYWSGMKHSNWSVRSKERLERGGLMQENLQLALSVNNRRLSRNMFAWGIYGLLHEERQKKKKKEMGCSNPTTITASGSWPPEPNVVTGWLSEIPS